MSEAREIIEDLVEEFAYVGQSDGHLALHTGGMSVLEEAFEFLGWEDPHPCLWKECQIAECTNEATCGIMTSDGYKRLCYKHVQELEGKQK